MADLDLDTEHLRWMGDTRFMYGMLRGIATLNPCPIELSMKIAEKDKEAMAESFLARSTGTTSQPTNEPGQLVNGAGHSALPALRYLPDDKDGWVTFEDPILFVYAGQGPYVGRDYMAFPVSLPDDGFVDLSVMPVTSRGDMVASLSGAETGAAYWQPKLQYYKAHAYRVKPLGPKGNLSVDGERFPFEEFQVEVHPRLGTFLSCYGRFATEFKHHKRPQKK